MTPGLLEEVAGKYLTIKRRRLQLEKVQRDLEDRKRILSYRRQIGSSIKSYSQRVPFGLDGWTH